MKKLKFVIASIKNKGGGSIVLENLCDCLNKQGYKCKIIHPATCVYGNGKKDLYVWAFIKEMFLKTIPMWIRRKDIFNIKKACKLKLTPCINRKTVVVYPDITYGNPLHAKRVVRWFLYHNRFKGDEKAYGKDDLFFAYRPVFNDYNLNPTCRTLNTPYVDLETYKRTNYGERKGKCYIIRKGRNRPDLPKEFDGPIIDDLSEAEKVKLFNECEWCISYDTQTAYSTISALCGCISVVVPEPGKVKSDYLKEGDLDYGVAFGFSESEIEHAISTRDKIYDYYVEKNEKSKEEVKKFVAICEEYFKDK